MLSGSCSTLRLGATARLVRSEPRSHGREQLGRRISDVEHSAQEGADRAFRGGGDQGPVGRKGARKEDTNRELRRAQRPRQHLDLFARLHHVTYDAADALPAHEISGLDRPPVLRYGRRYVLKAHVVRPAAKANPYRIGRHNLVPPIAVHAVHTREQSGRHVRHHKFQAHENQVAQHATATGTAATRQDTGDCLPADGA